MREVGGVEFWRTIVLYLARAARALDRQRLMQAIASELGAEVEALVGTIAEEWLREGATLGEARGEARARANNIVELVQDGLLSAVDAQATLQRAVREGRIDDACARDAWARIQSRSTER